MGPDLFLNSNRNGSVITLKSREYINLERHQNFIENAAMDASQKPKRTTSAAANWLKLEKEKVRHHSFNQFNLVKRNL